MSRVRVPLCAFRPRAGRSSAEEPVDTELTGDPGFFPESPAPGGHSPFVVMRLRSFEHSMNIPGSEHCRTPRLSPRRAFRIWPVHNLAARRRQTGGRGGFRLNRGPAWPPGVCDGPCGPQSLQASRQEMPSQNSNNYRKKNLQIKFLRFT